jgi:hypothetical protein
MACTDVDAAPGIKVFLLLFLQKKKILILFWKQNGRRPGIDTPESQPTCPGAASVSRLANE